MTIPMIGILIVAGIALVLGILCMISELWQRTKKMDECDEVPEGYWDNLDKHLANRPKMTEIAEGKDPDPMI